MPRLALLPTTPDDNWRALQAALPAATWQVLTFVRAQAQAHALPLYLVGGFVRDWLLGQPGLDLDLVTEGPAPRLARAVAETLGGRVLEHRAFGTATWWLPAPATLAARLGFPQTPTTTELPTHLDFVTARAETYPHPAALPRVRPADLAADLQRRDFTINAMAVHLTPQPGRFRDPFHGLDDLRHGRLRALHERSFRDDPTRLFRAVRYLVRYRLRLTPDTAAQWPQGLQFMPAVSGDRVRHELDRVLAEPLAGRMIRALGRRRVAQAVHPHLPAGRPAAQRVARGYHPAALARGAAWGLLTANTAHLPLPVLYALWWITVGTARQEALAQRLHLPGRTRAIVRAAARLWRTRRTWRSWGTARLTFHLERVPLEAVLSVAILCEDPTVQQRLDAFARDWRHRRPWTTGRDLQARGLPPGPLYAQILRALRAAHLEGRVTSRAEEARLLDHLLRTLRAIGEAGGRG